jgi:hypothetical protein
MVVSGKWILCKIKAEWLLLVKNKAYSKYNKLASSQYIIKRNNVQKLWDINPLNFLGVTDTNVNVYVQNSCLF